jgi:hypothetical protein
MAGKVLCVDELERSRRIIGAADCGAAGEELEIGAPKHGALLAVLALDVFTLRAPGDAMPLLTDDLTERRRGDERFRAERLEQMLAVADLGESSQRTASRIAGAARSFAPAPFQDDIQVMPATAAEVAA